MIKSKRVTESKQTLWLATGKIIAVFAQLLIPLFLTRFLNKEEYGFYTQFNAVLYFFISFFSFGMFSNLFYFFPTLKKRKILIVQTFIFLLVFSILSALFIFIPFFNSFFLGNEALKNYKFVIYFLTIILILTTIIHPLYVVNKDIGISLWFPALQIVLKAIFIIVFFLIIPSIQSVINAIVVSSVLVLLIVLSYLRKVIKRLPEGKFLDKEVAINQLRYNLPMGMAIAIKSFSQKFDKLISISFLSVSSYASYSIAFFGIPGIQQIYDSISQVTVVSMSKCFKNGDKAMALDLYKKMVVKTFSFSVPIIFIVALNAKQIISFLFTSKYTDATLLFQMYLISFIFAMLGAGLILRASGEIKSITRAFLYSSIFTLPSTYFLIKNYGSIGAMSGALLTLILPKIFQIKKEIQLTGSTLYDYLPWKEMGMIFLISIINLIPIGFLKLINEDNILYIIFISIVYLFLVFIAEIKLNVFIIDKGKVNQFKEKYLKF